LAPIFGYAPKHLVRKSEHTYSMPCGSRGACIDANRHAVVQSLSRLGEMLPSPEIIFACVSPVIGVLITYLGSLVLMYPPIDKFFLQSPVTCLGTSYRMHTFLLHFPRRRHWHGRSSRLNYLCRDRIHQAVVFLSQICERACHEINL